MVREGTRELLERHADLRVVGVAADGEGVTSLVDAVVPDVVLLDIRLPGASGIAVLRRLTAAHPSVKVLMLTAFSDREYIDAALAAGASGYLLKTASGEELVTAIRAVMAGSTVLDPAVSRQLTSHLTGAEQGELTPREAELVVLVAKGLPNKAVAAQLGISRRTVEGHLGRIFAKLGVTTRTELAHYATTHHLVEEEGTL